MTAAARAPSSITSAVVVVTVDALQDPFRATDTDDDGLSDRCTFDTRTEVEL